MNKDLQAVESYYYVKATDGQRAEENKTRSFLKVIAL